MNNKWIGFFLIFTNTLMALALLVILFKSDMGGKLLYKMGLSSSLTHQVDYQFSDNPNYAHRRNLFATYASEKAKIVMLGDSITYGVEWNELLGRRDIANRGISSDVTEGFVHRLSDVYLLEPEQCFIMGGINDIRKVGLPVETIFEHYVTLIESLQHHRIEPIIQSTLYISDEIYNFKEINLRVHELNTLLREYASENNITFIQVNKALSPEGYLNPSHTYDGVHLESSGYKVWKQLILNELNKP